MTTHDANLAQGRLDRKSTIKQQKTIREREEKASLEAQKSPEGQEQVDGEPAVTDSEQMPRAQSHVQRAKQLQDIKETATILDQD